MKVMRSTQKELKQCMKVMRSTQKELKQCMKDNLIEYVTNIWNNDYPSKWIKPYIAIFDKRIYPQFILEDVYSTYLTLKLWEYNRVPSTRGQHYSMSLAGCKVYRIGEYFLVKSGDTTCYDILRIRVGDKISVFDKIPPECTLPKYIVIDIPPPAVKQTPCLWAVICKGLECSCTMCPAHSSNYHKQPALTRAEAIRWWELQTLEPVHEIIKWQKPQTQETNNEA